MSSKFSRTHPFMASIKKRHSLCKPGTVKETQHLELDLSHSGIQYEVGDSIAVIPSNDRALVERILECLGVSGSESIEDPKSKQSCVLEEFLLKNANLRDCSRKFLDVLSQYMPLSSKKHILETLVQEENADHLKEYQNHHDIVDALEANREINIPIQLFCELLKPMMPRFYSIASSQKVVGEEAHLTVVLQKWEAAGRYRLGVCTHFLCNLTPLNDSSVPVYLHPHRGFTLPKDPSAPIVMIGPGTGVAPFRAFMQEREALKASGKNWLFFGEWNRSHHFFYEDYWESLAQSGKLRMDLAFSRDQAEKVYVQHRMLDNAKELFRWIEEGAYLYVCGDASRMSKDVDAALLHIIKEQGGYSEVKAMEYIKNLRHSKRFLKDVY